MILLNRNLTYISIFVSYEFTKTTCNVLYGCLQGFLVYVDSYSIFPTSIKDKTVKSEKLHRNQQRLLINLITHGFTYTLGYVLKDKDGIYHEKGVDVHIAINIVSAAYEATCKRIYLVSSLKVAN